MRVARTCVRSIALALPVFLAAAIPVTGQTLPEGFQFETVFGGLDAPTVVQFAPDGRIFVAEKSGQVKVWNDLQDTMPDIVVDLREAVHDFWDRGLMGLAVDPQFPTRPYIYVLYTYNFDAADPGAGVPRWPDSCPEPPGATRDGCVADGRLSRIEVAPDNSMVGAELVLVENRWCTQFPSHTVGTLAFDAHGALLAGAGDGANINTADYGQNGGSPGSPTPANPCGDPPGGRGVALHPPSAEGGALRAQDLRTAGDPVSYDGAIIRVDPDTGLALSTNPLFGGDPEDDRVIAYGLRNPFRFAPRPGGDDVWIGDVGWDTWEEINRITDVTDAVVENFGWPCYEGPERQPTFDGLDLTLCENLYADATSPATPPFFAYRHGVNVDPEPGPLRCTRAGSSSVAGMAFSAGSAYPASYADALFFSDFSRACIFVMYADEAGLPDPATRTTFAESLPAVQLVNGPDGMLYYPDLFGGTISRIRYFDTNVDPRAVVQATPTSGLLPLEVQFDGTSSFDPDSDATLLYAWDLDGDGDYDDSALASPLHTYTTQLQFTARLRVTDAEGASDVDEVVITAGNRPPTATIVSPDATTPWSVGDTIDFVGQGHDPDDGTLPGTALHWTVTLSHCPDSPDDCHTHPVAEFDGVSEVSFSAPDHEWYSYLGVELTVHDSGFGSGAAGVLSDSAAVALLPEAVPLTFESDPPGLTLVFGGTAAVTPFTRYEIVGSTQSMSAPSPQGNEVFFYWSDGGNQAHEFVVPGQAATYRATFADQCAGVQCLPILRVASPPTAFAPHPTIQSAVDAVTVVGSRIEVLPGSAPYEEHVTVLGEKGITIRGLDDQSGNPVVVHGGANPAFSLLPQGPLNRRQVTLENMTLSGRIGVFATSQSVLRDLRFASIDETALVLGDSFHHLDRIHLDATVATGIDVAPGAGMRLTRSIFRQLSGPAILLGGIGDVVNSVFDRTASGIVVEPQGTLALQHSTLWRSGAFGIDNMAGGSARVAYSIVWDSQGADLAGVACDDVIVSDVGSPDCGGVNGNLSSDPLLLPDFRPDPASPVLDYGPPITEMLAPPCTDLIGNARFRDNDGDGIARVDLGALEPTDTSQPAEVRGLQWSDPGTLTWTPDPLAVEYHVYRGSFAEFGSTSIGECRDDLDPDRTDTTLLDAEAPASNTGFFYLITLENAAGDTSTAGLAKCAERSIGTVCSD